MRTIFLWIGVLTGVSAGLAVLAGTAGAETLIGTITSVDRDRNTVMFSRADTRSDMALAIKSRPLLEKLYPGMEVVLDADRRAGGRWDILTLATTGIHFRAPEQGSSGTLQRSAGPGALASGLRSADLNVRAAA